MYAGDQLLTNDRNDGVIWIANQKWYCQKDLRLWKRLEQTKGKQRKNNNRYSRCVFVFIPSLQAFIH